jgi:hypothetical protein
VQHHQLISKVFFGRPKLGGIRVANRSPGVKESNNHRLAPEIGERDLFAGGVGKGEIRRKRTNLGRLGKGGYGRRGSGTGCRRLFYRNLGCSISAQQEKPASGNDQYGNNCSNQKNNS